MWSDKHWWSIYLLLVFPWNVFPALSSLTLMQSLRWTLFLMALWREGKQSLPKTSELLSGWRGSMYKGYRSLGFILTTTIFLLYHHFHLFFFSIFIYLAVLDLNCGTSGIFGLSCDIGALVPWPRIEPRSPALGAQSLSHWTTKKVSPLFPFGVTSTRLVHSQRNLLNEYCPDQPFCSTIYMN